MKSLILLLALAAIAVSSEKVRFENFSLYRIVPKTDEEVKILEDAEKNNANLNFWNRARKDLFLNVVVSPADKEAFSKLLTDNNIEWEITVDNVQSAIDKQMPTAGAMRNPENFNWSQYQTLEDIYAWLDHLAASYPDIVTVIVGGTSTEGREIKGIKISHGTGRKGAFIEGGMHAREWIAVATVTYIANELLTSDYPETVAAAQYFDWYIFPVTNPDGYVYSHEVNRMWRKNTRPISGGVGIDLNRNWNNYWNEYGAVNDPQHDTYPGNGPFSEIETRTLSSYIAQVAPTLDMFLSFHSFGQMILVPYGHTTEPLDNYWNTVTIGRRAMGSLAVRFGTQYVVGNIAETIYMASGGSIDWVKSRFQVPFVACYELRDRGAYGFLLPPEQIIPNSEEVFDSLLAIIREGKFIGYFLE